ARRCGGPGEPCGGGGLFQVVEVPTEEEAVGRVQPLDRSSAADHCSRSAAAALRAIAGSNRRSICHCPVMAATDGQNPTPSPARYAAPSAVVSVTDGRTTGTPSRSA